MTRQECINKLTDIFLQLKESKDYSKAKERLIGEIKVDRLSNYLLHKYEKLDEEEVEVLHLLLDTVDLIYNNSSEEEIMTDEVYDKLFNLYLNNNGEYSVGASTLESDTATHNYPDLRGTIKKVHFICNDEKENNENRKSLEDYENSWKRTLDSISYNKIKYIMSIKWDGLSGNIECDKFGSVLHVYPRGLVSANETIDKVYKFYDYSLNGRKINGYDILGIPRKSFDKPFCIKVEFLCSEDSLKILNDEYSCGFKNRRSAVSGILNSDNTNPELINYLTIMPLRYQLFNDKDINMVYISEYPYPVVNISNRNKILSNIEKLKECAEESGFSADGVVLTIEDKDIQDKLGRDDDKGINKYEVAYKFPPEVGTSRIIDVDFTMGTMGIITPVAKIEPIILKGNTIKSINLGSIDRYRGLNICRNDEVKIKYDVIPYLYKDNTCESGWEKIEVPVTCKFCGGTLLENPTLMCVNTECPSRQKGKILNYINKMNILNISEAIVDELFNERILLTIPDLYTLDRYRNKILCLDGWGPNRFKLIWESINSKRDVYDYELLGSLGIQSVGRTMFKRIITKVSLKKILNCLEVGKKNKLYDKIIEVDGIQNKTANKVVNGLFNMKETLYRLMVFLNVKVYEQMDIKGYICFTNIRDKDLEETMNSQGYEISNSVSKKTSMLVIPDEFKGGSSKLDKAKNLNIPIYEISEVRKIFSK